jgi:hypothetical protein
LDFPHVLFAPHCFALSHPASAHPVCARRGERFADADMRSNALSGSLSSCHAAATAEIEDRAETHPRMPPPIRSVARNRARQSSDAEPPAYRLRFRLSKAGTSFSGFK